MASDRRASARSMRLLPMAAAALLAAAPALSGCGEEERSYVANVGDGESTPTMLTFDVNTYISDSGYTRYYITAPLWGMYEDAADPFWRFPQGLELEQYDRDLNVTATMRCDSAHYLSQKRIWRLDGNVVMVNSLSDSFLTQQVYWDQGKREVYSDSFIHIVRSDRVIEGYGFTSNETMTAYTVNKPTGIFPVNKGAMKKEASDTAQADTAAPRRPARREPAQRQQPIMWQGAPS